MLLDDPGRARRLGRAGRRRAEEYGWDRVAEATARVYRSVVDAAHTQDAAGARLVDAGTAVRRVGVAP